MNRRRAIATLLAAASIPCLALWLSVGKRAAEQTELLWTDLPWYFTPTFAVLHRALVEGFFPLWNPWQLAGWPFLAAFQTQALYAPAWAVAWLPPHLAVTAYGVLHWAFAFVGATVLASAAGIGWEGAAATSILYALSAPVVDSFFVHSAGLAICSWLPWTMAAAISAVRPGASIRSFALFAISLAAALLAGAPEHFLYLAIAVLVAGLWRAPRGGVAGSVRALVILVGGFAVGAALAAGQILPTVELMQRAVRSTNSFSSDYIERFAPNLDTLVRSFLFGQPGPGRLTVLWIPLAVAALSVRRTRRTVLVPLVAALLVLDFLRGSDGWTFPFFRDWVPFSHAFRTQVRATFVWAIFGSLVAGFGVDALTGALRSRWKHAGFVVAALVAGLFAESAGIALPNHVFVPLYDHALLYGSADLQRALASFDGHDRVFVDYGAPSAGLQHKFGQMQGARQVADYDALIPREYSKLFDVPEGTPWMGRLQFAPRTKRVGDQSIRIPGVPLPALDLLAARYYLAATAPGVDRMSAFVRGVPLYRSEYTVVERPAARPRTWIVHEAVAVANEDEAFERLKGFDIARSAIVESPLPSLDALAADAVETATVTEESPNHVGIDAVCTGRCLLVLADLAFPGWSASVDGVDTPILTADYLLRAVALAPGHHAVSFVYCPKSWELGAGVSVATLLVLGGACFALPRRRKRGQSIVS